LEDEETILNIRAKAIQFALEGKTILEWTGEGTSAGHQFTMPVADILEETMFALKQINPGAYGHFLRNCRPFFA
jgi:hypothetical protein